MGANEKVNILLVDDQPARLLTYQSVLSELGQNLVCAHSGLDALDKLMREEFAVVRLGVSMRGRDGFEAARLIHDHPRFEKTPIIFVSGVHVTDLDHLKGYKVGAVDYVPIPVVPEILRSKVAVLVELYCKRRELEALNATLQRANAELERANRTLQSEVAERARAEQALKEADRHKDEFLAMLAHELRNPLAPILNAVQLMRMKPIADPQLSWSRDVIERQLSHLTRLVDDLLDVARITRGRINLSQEPTELAVLIARAVETVQPLIQARGHEFTSEIPAATLRINADPLRLTQAFGNVLSNAAKYTERGGRISLTVCRQGTDVEIRVRDTGVGIPAEQLPRIFDLFTQVRSDHSQSGLGIGLALVRRLLQMHGGTITAHSEGPGQGTEFLIRLPLLLETAHSANGEKSTTATDDAPPVRRRILVADDNADALETLATVLELGGHEVFSAANGSLALESADRA